MRFVLPQDRDKSEEEQRVLNLECPSVADSEILSKSSPKIRTWVKQNVQRSGHKELTEWVQELEHTILVCFATYLLCVESVEGFKDDDKVKVWRNSPGFELPNWWPKAQAELDQMMLLSEDDVKN